MTQSKQTVLMTLRKASGLADSRKILCHIWRNDNDVWNNFVKAVLKNGLKPSVDEGLRFTALNTLSELCKVLYKGSYSGSANDDNENDESEWTEEIKMMASMSRRLRQSSACSSPLLPSCRHPQTGRRCQQQQRQSRPQSRP